MCDQSRKKGKEKMCKFRIYSICVASAVLFSFMSSPMVFSQTKGNVGKLARHDKKDFSFGLKVGLNSSLISEGGDDVVSGMGLAIGVFGALKLGTDLGLSAELLYSQQGCEFDRLAAAKLGVTSAKIKFDYLNIPILINWYLPWVEGLTVKGGLQPAFLLASTFDFVIGDISFSSDSKESFETLDFAIPLGVSYELDFGLLLDVRYNIGITNVFKNSDDGNNRVFQFTVGYRF